MKRTIALLFIVLASVLGSGQITIDNPKHLDIPEGRAKVLLNVACKVVGEKFHRNPANLEFPVILVLGQPWHYTADADNGVYAIYLETWDDTRFASSAMMLAVSRVVPTNQYKEMVAEILKRSKQILPVRIHGNRAERNDD
jgi:hypothetical protein